MQGLDEYSLCASVCVSVTQASAAFRLGQCPVCVYVCLGIIRTMYSQRHWYNSCSTVIVYDNWKLSSTNSHFVSHVRPWFIVSSHLYDLISYKRIIACGDEKQIPSPSRTLEYAWRRPSTFDLHISLSRNFIFQINKTDKSAFAMKLNGLC